MRRRRLHILLAALVLLVTAQAATAAPVVHKPIPHLISVVGYAREDVIRGPYSVRGFVEPTPTVRPTVGPTPTPKPIVAVRAPVKLGLPGWQWPIRGPITTWFSVLHLAIDIAAACGTPVVAAHAGTVVWAGWKTNGGGNVVDIAFPGGLASNNHLSAVKVKVGQIVQKGQPIGLIGETGWASGCHLHFAVLLGKVWVNPLLVLP